MPHSQSFIPNVVAAEKGLIVIALEFVSHQCFVVASIRAYRLFLTLLIRSLRTVLFTSRYRINRIADVVLESGTFNGFF